MPVVKILPGSAQVKVLYPAHCICSTKILTTLAVESLGRGVDVQIRVGPSVLVFLNTLLLLKITKMRSKNQKQLFSTQKSIFLTEKENFRFPYRRGVDQAELSNPKFDYPKSGRRRCHPWFRLSTGERSPFWRKPRLFPCSGATVTVLLNRSS